MSTLQLEDSDRSLLQRLLIKYGAELLSTPSSTPSSTPPSTAPSIPPPGPPPAPTHAQINLAATTGRFSAIQHGTASAARLNSTARANSNLSAISEFPRLHAEEIQISVSFYLKESPQPIKMLTEAVFLVTLHLTDRILDIKEFVTRHILPAIPTDYREFIPRFYDTVTLASTVKKVPSASGRKFIPYIITGLDWIICCSVKDLVNKAKTRTLCVIFQTRQLPEIDVIEDNRAFHTALDELDAAEEAEAAAEERAETRASREGREYRRRISSAVSSSSVPGIPESSLTATESSPTRGPETAATARRQRATTGGQSAPARSSWKRARVTSPSRRSLRRRVVESRA